MAATDVTRAGAGEGDDDAAFVAASRAIGPLRNPDDCVLVCPDCTCRQVLELRRGSCVDEADGASTKRVTL